MLKLLYKPVAIVAGIVGGLLSGLIFKWVWKVVGRGSDAPAPMDSERGWGEILLAAGLHGAIYALVKTAVDRGAAEWTRKKTGIWPGGTLQQPDKSPDHRQAEAAVIRRSNLGRPGAGHRQRGHQRPLTGSMTTGSGMTAEAAMAPRQTAAGL